MIRPPSVMLATIALNEMEWLPSLYRQHKDWPGMVRWVFVEGADRAYAECNPTRVSQRWDGPSIDGTGDFLRLLAQKDERVTYVNHGIGSPSADPAQGKCQLRNRCWDVAGDVRPDHVMVLDCDEFYTRKDQGHISQLASTTSAAGGILLRQRHIWRPASVSHLPLFHAEVTGAYWNMQHCRVWRWGPGMRHEDNHNNPSRLLGRIFPFDRMADSPQCIHLGFASSRVSREAKHRYYQGRGEGRKDGRQMYVDCRRAFEVWRPGDVLPHGALVVPYYGPKPEVFMENESGK